MWMCSLVGRGCVGAWVRGWCVCVMGEVQYVDLGTHTPAQHIHTLTHLHTHTSTHTHTHTRTLPHIHHPHTIPTHTRTHTYQTPHLHPHTTPTHYITHTHTHTHTPHTHTTHLSTYPDTATHPPTHQMGVQVRSGYVLCGACGIGVGVLAICLLRTLHFNDWKQCSSTPVYTHAPRLSLPSKHTPVQTTGVKASIRNMSNCR
jgi:carbohydrate-binding DOMON domain-containing protein